MDKGDRLHRGAEFLKGDGMHEVDGVHKEAVVLKVDVVH